MAAFPCPYCGHSLATDDSEARLERCPSCDGSLLIAYRYRLTESHGPISGGELYLARDDGFDEKVAVLFAENDPKDPTAVDRFLDGSRLFADLGGRGLVKIHEIGRPSDPRAYVVMDWLGGGTLDRVVERNGALDQADLLALVGDLLTGASKAHRAMPAIIHGHIHPGKVGFRRKDRAVLFGFEWARHVNAQASHLADSFMRESETDDKASPAADLRQLGVTLHYAATAEWIGDLDLARQRARVNAGIPGPLGVMLDRMLGAGVDGYKNAVEASIDFDQLMSGSDRWQVSTRRVDLSTEQMGTAWTSSPQVERDPYAADGDGDDDDDDTSGARRGGLERGQSSSPPRSSLAEAKSYQAELAKRQAAALQARAAGKPNQNVGRVFIIMVGVMIAAGVFFASMESGDDAPVQQFRGQPRSVEAIPHPDPVPSPPNSMPSNTMPEPVEMPGSGLELHRYRGVTTGPEQFAGLRPGEACDVWVAPNPNGGSLNCRWYVDCGEPRRRIYGGGDVGFSTCELDDEGAPVAAKDEEDDAPDGAFVAKLDGPTPMLIVRDRWLVPPVLTVITISDGGPEDGPVPEVSLAPRESRETIERLIAAGAEPEIQAGVIADW